MRACVCARALERARACVARVRHHAAPRAQRGAAACCRRGRPQTRWRAFSSFCLLLPSSLLLCMVRVEAHVGGHDQYLPPSRLPTSVSTQLPNGPVTDSQTQKNSRSGIRPHERIASTCSSPSIHHVLYTPMPRRLHQLRSRRTLQSRRTRPCQRRFQVPNQPKLGGESIPPSFGVDTIAFSCARCARPLPPRLQDHFASNEHSFI